MTNLNRQVEGKHYFKDKVGVLMQEYELNQQKEQLQKQRLKQNIMLQIMNQRGKGCQGSQGTETGREESELKEDKEQKEPTGKTSGTSSVVEGEQRGGLGLGAGNQVEVKQHAGSAANSVTGRRGQEEEYQPEQSPATELEEMTFNMKKRNRSLEDEFSYQPNMQTEEPQEDKDEVSLDEVEETNKSINRIAKLANKYFPQNYKPNQEPLNMGHQEYNEEGEEEEGPPYEDEQDYYQEEVEVETGVARRDYNNPSFLQEDMMDSHSHGYSHIHNQNHVQKHPSYLRKPEYSQHYSSEQKPQLEEENSIEEHIPEDHHQGAFHAMDDSESMSASQLPKNCAFQIKMQKSVDQDHLEEMRKQKIKEMERKREQRIQEFRKVEADKKVEQPKPRHGISPHKVEKNDKLNSIEVEVPRSTNIERKSNMHRPPKMENRSEREILNRNQPVPLESQHQMKPGKTNNSSNAPSNNSYRVKYQQEKQPSYKDLMKQTPSQNQKAVSPIRTPKTVISERPKSSHRNSNIFNGESPYPRDKSASRMQQPKIEPKQRKNSFSRQSNKKLMINAITYVCLPGELNRKERLRLVDVLQSSQHEFFIFLFKEYSRKIIKGIYTLDSSQTRLERVFGDKAPYEIGVERVHQFYRFDSGSRDFKKVDGCRSFSLSIHAVDIK